MLFEISCRIFAGFVIHVVMLLHYLERLSTVV